jgi:hypothetical protein
MKLILTHGYPYPYPFPDGFDAEEEGYDCRSYSLEIEGVVHFEWVHTVTVEFAHYGAYEAAKELTKWEPWGDGPILEAATSGPDGYDHPAIVVGDKAYCGFILRD